MLSAYLRASTVTALSFFAVALLPAASQGQIAARPEPGACEEASDLVVLPAPLAPWKGAPLRVVVASEKPFDGALSLIAPNGSVAAASRERHGGPPYFWYAEVASPAPGTWRARIEHEGAACSPVTRDIAVSAVAP
ncbi:MAG: hypothetical protein J2P53_10445, partial [Bradyrhizobiaceae bacterium]|nr:hypothetical protein [Bradyrhizobiaceae bacterium]